MEIPACPVLHPTEEEFSDFYRYIHHLDTTYKQMHGMVKIVPPPSWKPQALDYKQKLQNLMVKNPIEQNVQGRGGFYESKNIVQPKMSLKTYKRYAERQSSKVASATTAQKQKLFWKTVTYSPPIYGADLTGTLMDERAGEWNLNTLNSLLRYSLTERVKGVTEPYCYIGAWKAFFSWHKQDLDLSALNYIHEGASKFWYSIARDDGHILQEEARKHFKTQAQSCPQFLRHKTFLVHPEILLQRHPEIKVSKTEQKAGQIMMVFGGAYHSGFNTGFNIAQAVNYATLDWLGQLLNISFCKCFRKSVKGQIESILYNLENSSLYPELSTNEKFKALQIHVLEQQYLQGGMYLPIPELKPVIVEEVEVKVEAKPKPVQEKEKEDKSARIVKFNAKYEEWEPSKNLKKAVSTKATPSLKIKKESLRQKSKTLTDKLHMSQRMKKSSKAQEMQIEKQELKNCHIKSNCFILEVKNQNV